ncbi:MULTISPECIES: hypothetical protein [unclassified Fusibacter]|uniref:alpha/beta hydrolase family protein n=1 Tax=unclassified Fusibacter TaxID=2624464 RepID=UPI0013E930C0|nr:MULTISPECIES: hypothetical protein [unclassified Fusibacter]MCK8061664.1 hypothetical protein [Fusibacter sp. A2]NPE23848.1 hypothetical protein [Fusibacter sp. A1]
MRPLEIVMLIMTLLSVISLIKLPNPSKRIMGVINVGILLSFILQITFEGVRWQLAPLYLVGGLTVFLVNSKNETANRLRKTWFHSLLIILVLLSAILMVILPVLELPLPTGDYRVGTVSMDVSDDERLEIYSEEEANRKIRLQIWYPSDDITGGNRVKWIREGVPIMRGLSKDWNLPYLMFDHTALIESNSYENVNVSRHKQNYPLVVISHGWSGFRNLHTDLAEELASHGYIVVSIDHTYGSIGVLFDDGNLVYKNPSALPNRHLTSDFLDYASKLVTTYAGDVTLALNELEFMNKGQVDSLFKGKINFDQVGLLGHSTGGGGDVLAAISDNRIKALFGMDAWVEPLDEALVEKGLDIPAVFLRSGDWEAGLNNDHLLKLISSSQGKVKLYQIMGTTHYDFSMSYMYSPLTRAMKLTGDLSKESIIDLQRSMALRFFDRELKGVTASMIDNTLDWSKYVKETIE